MARMIIAWLLLFTISVSTATGSLGLGQLVSSSALNQPFDGEVALYGIDADEIDAVEVRLASLDDFNKFQLPRPHFLTQLEFRVQLDDDGLPLIKISSREAMREPFVDFLMEVVWAQGRMIKQYTILLNPPRATIDRTLLVSTTNQH